jgi:dihydrofolate reductase
MRKLTAAQLVTLDGVVGRRTYQDLAEDWLSLDDGRPIARYLRETSKYVVSSTLEVVDCANSTIVSGDLHEEVAKLKELPGRDILVIGSPTLVRSLLRDGLLDELALIVHPIVAGGGTRLFEDLSFGTALRLVDSHTFDTGVVSLTFEPRMLAVAA